MRISAYNRLRALPDVFTTKTLAASLGGNERLASVYLHRWRKEEMISSIGPRAGLHFNLLRNPQAEETLLMDAVAYLFPGAVIAGASAVHAAGWTTQIPQATEIMIPARRTFPELTGFEITRRDAAWFGMARSSLTREGPVPMVSPGFALADLWHSGSWRPDPDDLDWDMIDPERLAANFRQFGLDIPQAWRREIEDYARPCAF